MVAAFCVAFYDILGLHLAVALSLYGNVTASFVPHIPEEVI